MSRTPYCVEEGVVLWRVYMRNARLEEGQLQIAHFLPVDHFGIEIEAEPINDPLDIIDRDLGVPPGIDMEHQRTKIKHLLRGVDEVGAIDPPAHSDDAVEILALAILLDRLDHLFEIGAAILARVPVGQGVLVIGATVVANALVIEGDLRIRGVHNAIRTDSMHRRWRP